MKQSERIRLETRIVALEADVRMLVELHDSLQAHEQSLIARLDAMDKVLSQYANEVS